MENILLDKLNYWVFIILMMLGLWAMIAKKNMIKKIMGLGIFQAAIILFYVSIGSKEQGTDIPIYPYDLVHPKEDSSYGTEYPSKEGDPHEAKNGHSEEHSRYPKTADLIDPDKFNNPLPHVLMLTAIVVGVATLGVGLALIQRIYRIHGSIEEDEVLASIAEMEDSTVSEVPQDKA